MVILLTASGLIASETRMESLGNPYGFIRDNTDIFVFPATIHRHNNELLGELNDPFNNLNWTLGANFPLTEKDKDYVLGLHLNRATGFDVEDVLGQHSEFYSGDLDITKKVSFLLVPYR